MRTAPLLLAIVAALAFGASSISAATTQVTISKNGFNAGRGHASGRATP